MNKKQRDIELAREVGFNTEHPATNEYLHRFANRIRAEAALERMAENERELGIQMKPADEPFGYFQYSIRMDAWVQNRDSNKGAAFYTRPQPAAWVGLTDEEIVLVCAECAASAHRHDDINYARAIERRLKEKNT